MATRNPWDIPQSKFSNQKNFTQQSIQGNQDAKSMGYRQWWQNFYDTDLSDDYRWGMTGGYTSSYDHGRLNKNGDMHGSSFSKGKYLPTWNAMANGDYKTFLTSNQTGATGGGATNVQQGISTASDGYVTYTAKKKKNSTALGL